MCLITETKLKIWTFWSKYRLWLKGEKKLLKSKYGGMSEFYEKKSEYWEIKLNFEFKVKRKSRTTGRRNISLDFSHFPNSLVPNHLPYLTDMYYSYFNYWLLNVCSHNLNHFLPPLPWWQITTIHCTQRPARTDVTHIPCLHLSAECTHELHAASTDVHVQQRKTCDHLFVQLSSILVQFWQRLVALLEELGLGLYQGQHLKRQKSRSEQHAWALFVFPDCGSL